MSKKKISKVGFQVGDILIPRPGKTQSNYWSLGDLKELQVVRVEVKGESTIVVKIIKGRTNHREYYNHKRRGDTIHVNDSMFKLMVPKEDVYDIF